MFGRQSILQEVLSDIYDFVQDEENDSAWVLVIKGEFGAGKSLFARNLLLDLAEQEKTIFSQINVT